MNTTGPGDPILCRIHSPKRKHPRLYSDLEQAFEDIAAAKERGGYTMLAVVGSREFRQFKPYRDNPQDKTKPIPKKPGEKPGRLEYRLLNRAVQKLCRLNGITRERICIVSGGARGVDRLAEVYAFRNGMPLVVFEADWEGRGRGAGVERNAHIAAIADEVVALPRSEVVGGIMRPAGETGTMDTVRKARLLGKPVSVL